MNQTAAHLITLWAAMLSKTEKGIERRLPQGCTLLQYRVLLQLALPETACLRVPQLARALVARPSDVQAAVAALEADGLVERRRNDAALGPAMGSCHDGLCRGCSTGGYFLTQRGQGFSLAADRNVQAFLRARRATLSPQDEQLIMAMYYDALVKPGSFFAVRATSMHRGCELPMAYYVTLVVMLSQAMGTTAKRMAALSLTDFRFLLELYPKRRGVKKRLRAKDVVRYLRVGKSYVTTASYRLEERGLLARVPDERDARGTLFELTVDGVRVVQEVGDDIQVLFGGLLGMDNVESGRMVRALKALLKGTEKCFDLFAADVVDEAKDETDDPAVKIESNALAAGDEAGATGC